ncbi:SDR family NAD(P)-dependent oxidoreductase [Neolewinella litorea]|uniref:SDR family NAD(P)-dependent oxidoreductase n=1 Tax=Neolewinella litorea TaxID=2562452 RepID=A0A4S4NQH7_9BACT|nr:SDR family NAD(P)-dependent oxidoreductase [Neolewinella litorea]THH41405.1 SDR family NAD(P)-dependent oxidoreductase [Neolewinella litorea]
MSLLAIAYSHEDLSTAQRLAGAVEPQVEFEHYSAGRANEGELLVDLLRKNQLPLVVLVSHNFLTNPNCMLRAAEWLQTDRTILPIVVDGHRYDPDQDEVITETTTLADRSDITRYLSLWQDRYIELRRGGEHYTDAVGQHAFKNYLRKIRDTSIGVEEVMELILARQPIEDAELRATDYAPLYQMAGQRKPLPQESSGAASAGATPEPQVPASPAPQPAPAPQPEPEEMTDTLLEESIEEQLQEWISRAWRMSDAGDTAGGLELLHLSLENHPEELELHYQYALMLALAANRLADAREELDALLDNDPHYPDALFLSGELYSAAGDHQRARDDWERLVDVQPAYPEVNQRLGYLLADHFPGEITEAVAYLRRATHESSASGELFFRYAEALAQIPGKERKVVKMLEKAIQRDPEHAPAHYRLAVAQFDQGDFQQARKNYLLAVSLEPAFDTPANRRAFQAAGRPTPATTGNSGVANEALVALKQNIADLEAMLLEQSRPAPAPAAPEKPGSGKTVFLSGATSGIGLATARRLAREGYRIIIAARRTERLDKLASELRDTHGTEVHPITLDVSRRDRVGETVEGLPPEWENIDILINNAGKAKGFDPIHAGDLDHWDEMIDVNLRGLLYVTRAITPGMVARGRGMVINVASTAGKEVYPNGNVYCATKHAVDALTYSMRLDLVKHGIRVGQICPAHVEETEFAVVRFDGDRERARIYDDFQPLRSVDVAEAIHFMVSQPPHVNIMDVVLQGTQQASSTVVDRSGRAKFAPAEEE